MATITKRRGVNGVHYRVQIRRRGAPTISETFARASEARQWAAQVEAAIHEGRYHFTREEEKHTLANAIDRYLATVLPGKAPRTIRNQTFELGWWKEQLGYRFLSEVNPPLIIEYREKFQIGRSPSTVNRAMAALRHMFSVAVREWEWMEENPVKKIAQLREPRGRVRFLTSDERERLLAAAQESKNPDIFLAIMLSLSTGMRQMELLTLEWRQIDFTRNMITLEKTKNNERRSVPLAGLARELLLRRPRRIDTNIVFPSIRNPRKHADMSKAWEYVIRRSGIEDFCWHDMRHDFASHMAMSGASLHEIATLLGHKTLQMVMRYAHLTQQHLHSVVERMVGAMYQ
jgi:integrase